MTKERLDTIEDKLDSVLDAERMRALRTQTTLDDIERRLKHIEALLSWSMSPRKAPRKAK